MTSTTAAWTQFWAAVLPALAAFLVAALGAGALAVRNWVQVKHLGVQVKELQDAAVPATPTIVAVQQPAASGSGSRLLAAPVWNQLDDPLPDGNLDPQAAMDCGEECVAMAVAACGGPGIPAGVFRALLGGPQRRGSTTAADLSYLLTLFGVANHPRQADPDAAWTEWQHSDVAGFLAIALGYWVTPGFLHWVLVRACDPGTVQFNDPWGGSLRSLDRATAQKLYAGQYIHIDQAVTATAGPPPGD